MSEDPAQFKIWDAHCHINTPGDTPGARMEYFMRIADRVGIERVCAFMSKPWADDPTPEMFRASNDDVLAILKDWSARAFGFVYLNPRYQKESLAELERCVADGSMVGVKLWVAERCSAADLDPIVRRAAELKAVILQHTYYKLQGTDNRPGESTPGQLAELSARHPGVAFISAHTGGGSWEMGIRAIRARPEIFSEISGSDPTSGIVEMAVRELGPRRVIYGSDASGRAFGSQIAKVIGAQIPIEAKRLILRENLRGALQPMLRSKGIQA